MKKTITLLTILMLVVFMVGCENSINPIKSQSKNDNEGLSLGKKGGNGNGGGKGDKENVIYTVEIVPVTTTTFENNLLNGCPETQISGSYNIIWDRHGLCANVTVLDADGLASVTLTDDPQLYVKVKRGKIVSMRFWEQDLIGAEGIQYSTEMIELDSPITPDVLGFTIPVGRTDIEVWRHKGHTGGPRVEMVGFISIGDIVYTPITP